MAAVRALVVAAAAMVVAAPAPVSARPPHAPSAAARPADTRSAPARAAGQRLAARPSGTRLAAVRPPGTVCAAPANQVSAAIPWPQQRLAYQRVWPLTRGRGITVAVVDSGVDSHQPQLAGQVRPGVDVLNGAGRADDDCVGHGTFVAGIVAARPAAGIGFVGVAPDVTILPLRQTDSGQDGTAAGLATAIRTAVDSGAAVVNVSVVSTAPSAALSAAVQYANARNVLVVAAAANDAQAGNPRTYPAAYPGVLAVGAVGPDDKRSGFSETGNFVDVAAPGMDVVSVGPGGPGQLVGSGTSYAAPFVAGVAALVRAYHPELTAAAVRRRIELTADHPAAQLPDPQVGWGIVDPYAAVTAVLPAAGAAAPAAGAVSPVHPPPPPDTHSAPAALLAAAACAVAGLLALIGSAVTTRGRRRGWRPGRPIGPPQG